MKRLLYTFLAIILALSHLEAQILDDSTQTIYGPSSVTFSHLNDLKYDRLKPLPLDTTLDHVHRYETIEMNGNRYQNLGNLGTANFPIFYELPRDIGITSGYNSFNLYFKRPDQVQYFDTKSPHTSLYTGLGGRGRNMVDVGFTRNISPTWNAGFDIKKITANKQVDAQRRDDRNAEAISYDFFMAFNSKDSTYQSRFSFTRNSHTHFESGGIIPPTSGDINDFFEDNVDTYLSTARNKEIRANITLYNQYRLTDLLKVYHELSLDRQSIKFQDKDIDTLFYNEDRFPPEFGPVFRFSDESTSEISTFRSASNTLGFKGSKRHIFYNFYLQNKYNQAEYTYLDTRTENENYFGSDIRLTAGKNDNIQLDLSGKILLEEGNYRIGGIFRTGFLEASYYRYSYRPSFLSERFLGNHYAWAQNFGPVAADEIKGKVKLQLGKVYIEPHLTLQNVNNQIYFNLDRRPEQADGAFQVLSPGLNMKINFLGKMWFEPSVILTSVTGKEKEIMQIPELFTNGRIYYDNHLFDDKLQVQVGLDMHYKSSYFAYGYDPVTTQFHLQNEFEVEGYLLADLFVDFRIGHWNFFVKMTNIGDQLLADGFFTTPYYRGQERVFDFGLHWIFFD